MKWKPRSGDPELNKVPRSVFNNPKDEILHGTFFGFALRVCLFGLKMLSEKSFPEFLVFGSKGGRKIIYPGKYFHAIGWKITSTTILLKLISDSFTTHQSHRCLGMIHLNYNYPPQY